MRDSPLTLLLMVLALAVVAAGALALWFFSPQTPSADRPLRVSGSGPLVGADYPDGTESGLFDDYDSRDSLPSRERPVEGTVTLRSANPDRDIVPLGSLYDELNQGADSWDGWGRTGSSRIVSSRGTSARWRPLRNGVAPPAAEEADFGRRFGGDSPAWPEPTLEERVAAANLDLATPEGRLERACLLQDYSRYACRCLTRVARTRLDPAAFDFLSRSAESDGLAARLRATGLGIDALPDLAAGLISVDAEARDRCRVSVAL